MQITNYFYIKIASFSCCLSCCFLSSWTKTKNSAHYKEIVSIFIFTFFLLLFFKMNVKFKILKFVSLFKLTVATECNNFIISDFFSSFRIVVFVHFLVIVVLFSVSVVDFLNLYDLKSIYSVNPKSFSWSTHLIWMLS